MKSIFESLKNLEVSEKCFKSIVKIVEEYINEVSVEVADEVSNKRYIKKRNAEERYQKTLDDRDCAKYEEESNKNYKNYKLRDKWDIFKGLKRGKDGEFHNPSDYKEYKEKNELGKNCKRPLE